MSTTSAAHPIAFPRGFKTRHPVNAFKIEGLRRFPIVYCLELNGRIHATRPEKTKRPARAEWGWPLPVWRGRPSYLPLRCFVGGDRFRVRRDWAAGDDCAAVGVDLAGQVEHERGDFKRHLFPLRYRSHSLG